MNYEKALLEVIDGLWLTAEQLVKIKDILEKAQYDAFNEGFNEGLDNIDLGYNLSTTSN